MATSNISLISSGIFYIIIGFWWHLQITQRYWYSKQQKTEFSSSVTYTCCNRCKKFPLEGLFKLIFSVTICACSIYQIQVWKDTSEQNQAIGQLTVFCLMGMSAVCDIILIWCNKILFPGLDYILIVVCFNVQSVVLSYHNTQQTSWIGVADTCGMYAASICAIAILLEFKFKTKIWFPLLRCLSTVVLGTWFVHMYIVLTNQYYTEDNETTEKVSTLNQFNIEIDVNVTATNDNVEYYQNEEITNLSLVPMYFTWHCLVNMNILIILWLLSWKLADKNCCCFQEEEEVVTRFENRVHFDYHLITHMTDSDNEP
ncbi:Transmembrane protein 45B [Mactra antiquata]